MSELKKMTLKCVLDRSVDLYGQNPALSQVDDDPLTYNDLSKKVNELSTFLHNRGVIVGDRVAILSENKPNWGIAFLAVTTMGAIAVPILPDFHASAVHHIIRHAGCKAIFISEKLYEKLEDGNFESLQTIILIDNFSIIPTQTKKDTLKEVLEEGNKEFSKLKETALRIAGRIPAEVQEDSVASIIYTSGTTGHSKGVMLTHKNVVSDAIATTQIVKVTENDRMLSVLPLSHTYECTLGFIIPIMQGSAVYYIDKPPTARVLLPAMEKIKPTMMLTVPLVIEKIYKMRILPELTKNGLRQVMYKISPVRKQLHRLAGKKLMASFGNELHFFGIGGASLSPEVEMFLREAKFPYAIGYGLTETSPLIAGTDPTKTKYRSTGPALPNVEIKINNPHPETGEGEIFVRGPNVMKGYYKDPERTEEVFTKDGWLKTGDLGIIDNEGYLYIKGRLKNMILGPSGENIYPEEIEAIIKEFDYVLESLVFEQQGQLVARVYLNYDSLDDEFSKLSQIQMAKKIKDILKDLRKKVNNRVASFSRIHKVIEQTEPFEKTPTQKIKRYLYVD